ncbi:uncharacterized protein LOC114948825 isoform X2 [Acropora millepora]|uniref:uncharacterized protein LOC114948825 isoform X2 n=1 Tax=Acropora millepora TaxID=45264 RepID=UPI001CF296BA|nr:uncharacterized protein LOC114948825 isoform X2 [Acropora millepora]XP_044169786.1 uncharacterized protein LOC114948825 isoform X2 [Acropora millepora]XP_044169789.1 uncharacterized protein LOC114948825 isoform X2 [Acropora millepora]
MAAAATGGATGALHSASEHRKRWVVFGLALNMTLVDQIRRYVESEVKKDYEQVKRSKGIDSQSKSGRLMKRSFDLKYQNINGNDKLPKGHAFDYRVTSHVDFAKLYLESFMAKFNAFDEHCDASAVLNLLGRVPVFSPSVQKAASDVRQARNSWAHCAFGDWDDAKFNQCFKDMEQLVKVLALPSADEAHLVNELNDWKKKGTLLCLTSPDPALLQFVKQHVNTLEMDVDKMAFDLEQERQAVKKSLHDVSTRIEKLEEGFSGLEHRVTKLEGGQTSALHLETANTEISSFESDIEYFAKFYDADTRHWLFSDFDRWFSDPGDSRAYVLLGDAGVGKTVIAAALVKRTQADGRLGACYFCRHNDSTRNNPRGLIGTVAYQLCKYNKEYSANVGGESRVTTILANLALGCNELFTKLLHEPLGKCSTSSQRMLVIIDALDETNYESREDFLELLKARFPLLPKWLVFFITSRPEDTVQFYLQRYNPCIKICAGNGQDDDCYLQHEADIRRFLVKKVNFSELPYSIEDVVAKSNGLFLYAYYISQVLSDRTSAIKGVNLADHFPGDIESFFLRNFKRVFDKLSEAGLYWKLFGCVIAAPAPLPLSFISFILEKENSDLDVQTVIDAVSQFMVVRSSDNTFSFLHNLIPSWLTSESKASRKLFIDRARANEYFKKIILTFLHCVLCDQQEGGVSINRNVRDYLLRMGVRFLCCNYDNRDSMETVFRCLTSFYFLQKRVDTNRLEIFSVVSDYKLCLQCQSFVDAQKSILEEICTALEKDIHVLVECPDLLPSCLRCTSETTKRKLTIFGDPLMMCNNLDCLPHLASTLSWKDNVFALSPDKKLLVAGDQLTGIVWMYDACSLKELLGPVDCQMGIDYQAFSRNGKFLLFGEKGVGLSVKRGRVEKIPTSYGEKRVLDQGRHYGHCLAYAFYLWAKLELSESKDCHSEVSLIFSPKVRCLLTVTKHCLLAERGSIFDDDYFYFTRCAKEPNDLQELHARLYRMKSYMKRKCEDCCRYYEQEPSLTALIRRIAGMHPFDYFESEDLLSGLFDSEFLTLCVSILKASREFPSSLPLKLRDCVIPSPNGKVIAVRDPERKGHTIKVFMNLTETDETVSFPDPVHVIKDVEASDCTCNSDFIVYVQIKGRCFQALSLQTGSILSCDSGFSPLFHIIPSERVGFVFCAGSEKSIVPLSDFLVSSALRKYLVLPVVTSTWSPSGITFTLGGNISYLSPNLVLYVVIRNGDGSFTTNCTPLKHPGGCVVENCVLSRQGNSIAVSQKASIFLFDNHAFHRTVFKESEDMWCQVSCLMFSHDGTLLLLYCVERRNSKAEVCLWNVDQDKLSSRFFASTLVSINCCCLSPDNSMVILCGELRVEIWENVLRCCRQCIVKDLIELYKSNERFHYCSVSSGNERLACCIVDDILLCSLDSPPEEFFWRLPPAHLGQIQFCQFFRETHYLISYGIDGVVFLWELIQRKAKAYARVTEREESITGMSVSNMEDEVVCLTSLGRVMTIKLHGLKSATIPSQELSQDAIENSLTFAAGRGYLTQEARSREVEKIDLNELFEEMDVIIQSDRSDDESDIVEIQDESQRL